MAEPSKYHLRVTAGASYDTSTHQLLHVNTSKAVHIATSKINADITVRIANYHGLPTDSPKTSPYFSHAPHEHDLYSIAFNFSLPSSTEPIPGTDLVFGNDFAHPIRSHLPPGFSTALRIVKWTLDPGLDGDVYAEEPYLYGPLLSSINVLHISDPAPEDGSNSTSKPPSAENEDEEEQATTEGGTGRGASLRTTQKFPPTGPARMKHFLSAAPKASFTFTPGLTYKCDFFNPYLDFNEFALKLPGFTLGIMKFWDGQPLRYVLKRKTSDGGLGGVDEALFVIQFALVESGEVEAEEARCFGASEAGEKGEKEKEEETKEKPKEGEQQSSGKYVDESVD